MITITKIATNNNNNNNSTTTKVKQNTRQKTQPKQNTQTRKATKRENDERRKRVQRWRPQPHATRATDGGINHRQGCRVSSYGQVRRRHSHDRLHEAASAPPLRCPLDPISPALAIPRSLVCPVNLFLIALYQVHLNASPSIL